MRSLAALWAVVLIVLGVFTTVAHAQSWELDVYSIEMRRHLAESKVAQLKAKVKDPEKLRTVLGLYDTAMAKHNAWLNLEVTALKGHLKLNTSALKTIAEDAGNAFVAYDSAANGILGQQTERLLAAVPAGLVGEIVGELIKGGIAFWKAKKDLDDARLTKALDGLTAAAQWRPWTDIAACAPA